MALLYCSECGNAIAENTSACPACHTAGYAEKFKKLFTAFIVMLLVGSAVFYFTLPVRSIQQQHSHTLLKKHEPWK